MAAGKLLLHVCCAPDATVPLEDLSKEGYDVTAYWWGKNIWPEEEERRRFESLKILLRIKRVPLVREEGSSCCWNVAAALFASEPEGGRRCELCFRLQFEAAAAAASCRGIPLLCTTLTISPHKNVLLINAIGSEIAEKHRLLWLSRFFRKKNGFLRSVTLSKELGLYRQTWCGCEYSMKRCGQ